MRCFLVGLVVVGMLGGCAGTGEQLVRLRKENQSLQQELSGMRRDISSLQSEKVALNDEILDLTRIAATLQREKSVRIEEAGLLRRSMRSFARTQMEALRDFSRDQQFCDYVGAELINRQHSGGEALTLVDAHHRLPGAGTLMAVRGYFIVPCRFRLLLLRAVGKQWEVVQNSALLEMGTTGFGQIDLDVPMAVRRGDVLGFAFSGPVGVPFDEGTGATMVFPDPVKRGSRLYLDGPAGSAVKRAYSIGGVGLLE
jgi:hypothetical protein